MTAWLLSGLLGTAQAGSEPHIQFEKYELENGVHALSLHLFTQKEWKDKSEYVKDSPPCAS